MAKKQPASESSNRLGRKLIFAVIATVFGLALLEGLTTFVWTGVDLYSLWTSAPKVAELREEFHCEYDEDLGWANVPGKQVKDFYGPAASISIDDSGLRSHSALDDVRQEDATKVVCLGDSFTLGYGVDDRQTYPFQLEQNAGGELRVFNMGQGGYSVGQDWLWLKRMLPELQPEVVVGVFIVEDFRRLAVVRTANGYGVPEFVVENERVVVRGVPVPAKLPAGQTMVSGAQIGNTLRQTSAIARTLAELASSSGEQTEDDVLVDGLYVLRELKRLCEQAECEFVLVLTPTLQEVFEADARSAYSEFELILTNFSAAEGIPFTSLQQAFQAARDQDLFLDEQFHHYSPIGNQLVAQELQKWLPTVSSVMRQPAE